MIETLESLRVATAKALGHLDEPHLEADLLIGHVLDLTRSQMWARHDQSVTCEHQQAVWNLIEKRRRGVPAAYLIGKKGFWDNDFYVTPETLIPRPETELLVETILARSDNEARSVVDLGTGSGAIAISLAKARPQWHVIATDCMPGAIEIAQQNANQVRNIDWLIADWLTAFRQGCFDIIVANPPYIDETDPHLDDLVYEPRSALVSGNGGFADLNEIMTSAKSALKPNGYLIVEHGFNQQTAVENGLRKAGLYTQALKDLSGQPRAVIATLGA